MRSTLFHIPREVLGLPLFGFGILLTVWGIVCAIRMASVVRRRGWSGEVWNELPVMLLLGAVIGYVLPGLSDQQGLPIRGYGVMVFLGVVSGVALAVYRAKCEGYDPELVYSLALWMSISAIIGARLFYVIEYWEQSFHKDSLAATLWAAVKYTEGGLVVYGAFVGGVISAAIFFTRYKLPIMRFADIIAPSLVLGLALGRIGCFLNGCCYGGVCDYPWAVSFPVGSPVYLDQASRGKFELHGIEFNAAPSAEATVRSIDKDSPAAGSGLQPGDSITRLTIETPGESRPLRIPPEEPSDSQPRPITVAAAVDALASVQLPGTRVTFDVLNSAEKPATRNWALSAVAPVPERSLPVHPTQLYSALGAGLLTLFLLAWYPLRRHEGEVTALMITIYPIIRILEEIIRNDEPLNWTRMTISQDISVLLLAAAAAFWIFVLCGPKTVYRSTANLAGISPNREACAR
jgi:phosphatidylglycerol---prolipoprotein diacylglyceryl transferase